MKKFWFKFNPISFLGETGFLSLAETGAAIRILSVISADGQDGFLMLPVELWKRKIGVAEKQTFFGLLEVLKFCKSFEILISEDGENVGITAKMISEAEEARAAKSAKNAAYRSKIAGLAAFGGISEEIKSLKKDQKKTEKSLEKVGYACAKIELEIDKEKKGKEKKEISEHGGGAEEEASGAVPGACLGEVGAPAVCAREPDAPAALCPAGGVGMDGCVPGARMGAETGQALDPTEAPPEPVGAETAPFMPAAEAEPTRPNEQGRLACADAPKGAFTSPRCVADPVALRNVLKAIETQLPQCGYATSEHSMESPAFAAFWRIYPNPAKNSKKEDGAFAAWQALTAENPSAELAVPVFCAMMTALDQWPKSAVPGKIFIPAAKKFLMQTRPFEDAARWHKLREWMESAMPEKWAFLRAPWERVLRSDFFPIATRRAAKSNLSASQREMIEIARKVRAAPEDYCGDGETAEDVLCRLRNEMNLHGVTEELLDEIAA